MPFDPSTGPLVLAQIDTGNYPNSRVLRGTTNAINIVDNGAGSTLSIAPLGNLLGLVNLNASGLVSYSPSAKQFFGNRIVCPDGSIQIVNPGGGLGGISLQVVDGTSNQNVTVESGSQSATTPTINLSSANSNMTISVTQNSVNNKSDVVFNVTGGGGSSGLTSVGLVDVSGGTNFNITNSPLTSNGNITLDIAIGGLPLSRIAQSGATTGQILSWTGSAWAPASASASSIAVVAPGLSSTTVTGITFSGSGVTGSAAGGVATITIPGGGSGSGLTSVGLVNESESILTFSNNPLTANGNLGIGFAANALPLDKLSQATATNGQVIAWDAGATSWNPANWSDIPAAGNVTILEGNYIDYGTVAIRQTLNNQYLQTYTGANGSGAIYDTQFYPVGGFGGTAGQILSLVTPAVFGSPGTPQVLQWIDKGSSTISVTAPGLSATAVGSITFSGSGVTGSAAGGVATITIPGGGGSGAVSSVSASGGTSVITPTIGDVVLQMDLPLHYSNTNFVIGAQNTSLGNNNFFVNGIGAPADGTSGTAGNTAFGYDALIDLTVATNNTAFGSSALSSSTTANHNTAIGANSQINTTTGSDNTSVGYSSGPNSGVVASRCTWIGSTSETSVSGISNSTAIGYNSTVNTSNTTVIGDPTSSMEMVVGSPTSIGFENETGTYSLLSLRNSENSCIYMDPSTGLSSSQCVNIPSDGILFQLVSRNLTLMDSTGYLSRLVTYSNDNDSYPNIYAPPAYSLLIGNANTTGSTQVSEGRDFLVLPPPSSGSGLPSAPTGILGYSPTYGTTWFSSAPALAASFLAFGGVGPTPSVNPAQHVSYIAEVDPDAPGNPTFFSLPSNFSVGSSFRVIGSNPYGWQISTNLPLVIPQKIIYANSVVTSTLSTIAGIQTDPNATYPSPTGYATDWAELTYIATEGDGTQVWSVMSSCNLDLFQS